MYEVTGEGLGQEVGRGQGHTPGLHHLAGQGGTGQGPATVHAVLFVAGELEGKSALVR